MKVRVVFVVLLVAALAAPIGANAADTVMTGGELGPEWKAYELTSDGSPVSIRWDLAFDREPQTVGMWTFNTDGTFVNGFQHLGFPSRTRLETHVEVTEGIEYDVDEQGSDNDYSLTITTGPEMPGTPEDPKTYIVLVFTGGVTSTPATWTMTGRVSLGDQTEGETLFVGPDDFDAPAEVSVERALPPVGDVAPFGIGTGAKAVVTGRKVIDVEGVFLGAWRNTTIPFAAYRSIVTDENGAQRDCTQGCGWVHYKAPSGWPVVGMPPGRYTFEHTGAGVRAASYGHSYLFGMDVTLPE